MRFYQGNFPVPPQVLHVNLRLYVTFPLPLHVLQGSAHKSEPLSLPEPAQPGQVSSPIPYRY